MQYSFGPLIDDTGIRFRLWAPSQPRVDLTLPEHPPIPMQRADGGFWHAHVAGLVAGARYRFRANGHDLLSMYTKTREQGFGNEVKRRMLIGTYALSSGYYDAYYGRAQKVRTLISRDFEEAFERFDFVVSPTAPGVAFELGAKTADPLAMYLNDFCTVPMSLAGIPAISIPNGLSENLPVGFQLAGPAFSENRVLDAAHALEQAIGFDVTRAFV